MLTGGSMFHATVAGDRRTWVSPTAPEVLQKSTTLATGTESASEIFRVFDELIASTVIHQPAAEGHITIAIPDRL